MQRFGQAGRMLINQHKIRAVTWLVAPRGRAFRVPYAVSTRQS
jgi:hypothetical protein